MATLKSEPQQPSAQIAQNPNAPVLKDDEDIIRTLGLDWTPERTKRYLEKVTPDLYCAETEKIKQYWEEAWENLSYADKRIGKTSGRRIQVVERSNFQHVIRRGESGLFFDEATKELVFARLPRVVSDSVILEAINEVCKSAARERRGDRRVRPWLSDFGRLHVRFAEIPANPPSPEAS
ncbi:hypothetical protein PV04_05060 [Phialophora macrospora]|uniref:Uncharacterized protein n=1 Tax=Phialophora macrospora TaxID=1851006 RepID=A0A0D2E482_9EURO|nr:hypothetical protein PV04_05060 [Phialophora macrospora]